MREKSYTAALVQCCLQNLESRVISSGFPQNVLGWCFAIHQQGRIMSVSNSKGIISKVSVMKYHLYWSIKECIKASLAPDNGQLSAPLILKGTS
jgi:hypothetical protein